MEDSKKPDDHKSSEDPKNIEGPKKPEDNKSSEDPKNADSTKDSCMEPPIERSNNLKRDASTYQICIEGPCRKLVNL